jgi:hypothetical protein
LEDCVTHFENLRDAANKLGVSIIAPAIIELPDGTIATGDVLVEGFGAPRGTIIIADAGSLITSMPKLRSAGYTVSSFRPSNGPMSEGELMAMLTEWTWQGDGLPPFAA